MRSRAFRSASMALAVVAAGIITTAAPAAETSEEHTFRVETLLERPGSMWSFDFLPDGRIIYTEKRGAMGIYDPRTRQVAQVRGVPSVSASGQGGLLDVRVHPDFAQNRTIYFTYSEPTAAGSTTALARATLGADATLQVQRLFSASPSLRGTAHYGSRIEFDGRGYVYVTVGERNDRHQAQNLGSHLGSIIRLHEDGRVPTDNPFVGQAGARPEIWSYGHRSPQGLVRHPVTGELWQAEMGPLGGDELNLVRRGANYGWPVVTYGREYSGQPIGEGTSKPGMDDPIAWWVPSISPSGITFYTGNAFPRWRHNIFMANLSGEHVRRLVLDGRTVTHQEVLLQGQGKRFRCVRTGPDGSLYYATDDGELGRLVPQG